MSRSACFFPICDGFYTLVRGVKIEQLAVCAHGPSPITDTHVYLCSFTA